MIPVDGKRTVFPVKLKLKGDRLNEDINKDNFQKDLMNLIETNYQVNMTSEHSVSSSKWLKSHLNVKSFNMFLTLW